MFSASDASNVCGIATRQVSARSLEVFPTRVRPWSEPLLHWPPPDSFSFPSSIPLLLVCPLWCVLFVGFQFLLEPVLSFPSGFRVSSLSVLKSSSTSPSYIIISSIIVVLITILLLLLLLNMCIYIYIYIYLFVYCYYYYYYHYYYDGYSYAY